MLQFIYFYPKIIVRNLKSFSLLQYIIWTYTNGVSYQISYPL
jgi:DNA modification methylase